MGQARDLGSTFHLFARTAARSFSPMRTANSSSTWDHHIDIRLHIPFLLDLEGYCCFPLAQWETTVATYAAADRTCAKELLTLSRVGKSETAMPMPRSCVSVLCVTPLATPACGSVSFDGRSTDSVLGLIQRY